ncbi:serine/threonine-protein kinase [Actinomadura sp. 9N407]|uniref:serine/threonine-protein kinase n=1 Tax=Actinomadura sp. 9N407 TaxID=3375154 RepID=UPI0037BB17C1
MPEQLLLAGRYRLLERLGSGGMGTVWSAMDETLRRDVAVKEVVYPQELTAEERRVATERARREARSAGLIDHPSVITVHDVVIEDDRPWIVMELIRGTSLEQLVRRHGPRPPAMVAGIGLQVLDALRAAHAKGIVHRDVKPSNVLLAEDGNRVILTDFGIASVESDPSLTRTGAFVGSPGYAAPERLREQPAGPESDLWSLAATLYMAVEGRAPFERDNHMASLGAVLTEDPAPPRQAGSLAPLLWYLLQKDPSARLTPDAVRDVLQNVASGRPSGLRDPIPTPPPRRRRSRVWIPVAAAAAIFALATGTVVAVALSGDDEPAASSPPPKPEVVSAPPSSSPSADPAALDLCTLLTPEQISRLFPKGTPERGREEGRTCFWTAPKHGLMITDIGRRAGSPPPESPTEAHNEFVSVRNSRAQGSKLTVWGWTEIGVRHVKATGTPARTAPGIGDEAFSYTTTGTSMAMDKTQVVLRAKNFVLEVEYVYARGAESPEKAFQASRWIAQSIAGRR